MSGPAGAEDEDARVLATLGRSFGVSLDARASIRRASRLYSSVWHIEGTQAGKAVSFYAKSGGGKAQREFTLCTRANELLRGRADFVPVDMRYDEGSDLLLSRALPGISIERLAARFPMQPWAWYGTMRRAAAAAGTWLRAWHGLDRGTGPVAAPLLRYAERRQSTIDRLRPASRERLLALIRSAGEAETATLHSDYAPGNIIWHEGRVGVVDYGIGEWVQMSPWWDILTFEVVLERNLALSRRSPLFLLPCGRRRILADFAAAYGNIGNREGNAWRACAAVRHLSFMRHPKPGSAADPITAWHAARLGSVLHPADGPEIV